MTYLNSVTPLLCFPLCWLRPVQVTTYLGYSNTYYFVQYTAVVGQWFVQTYPNADPDRSVSGAEWRLHVLVLRIRSTVLGPVYSWKLMKPDVSEESQRQSPPPVFRCSHICVRYVCMNTSQYPNILLHPLTSIYIHLDVSVRQQPVLIVITKPRQIFSELEVD